jgi:signal peptidase II
MSNRPAFNGAAGRGFWLTLAAVVTVDQITKAVVLRNFAPGESRPFLPHVVSWTFVQNHAGAFGLFGTQPFFLVGMALAVLAFFWYSYRDMAARSNLVRIAFGAIAGGAIGNIVDRLRHGYVVDFIDMSWNPLFNVFNVADASITAGVILLLYKTFAAERAQSAQPSAGP